MSEKRKPYFVFLLKKEGKNKSTKIELFESELWNKSDGYQKGAKRYRLRVNGKWFKASYGEHKAEQIYFTKWEIRDLIWRSIPIR